MNTQGTVVVNRNKPDRPVRLTASLERKRDDDAFYGEAIPFSMDPEPAQGDVDWSRLRQPPSKYDAALNLAAQAWMRQLPPEEVPSHTAARFPRIVNRIARNWENPPMMREIFADLLIDRRGSRRGFPLAVSRELHALYDVYRQRHPDAEIDVDIDIWGAGS